LSGTGLRARLQYHRETSGMRDLLRTLALLLPVLATVLAGAPDALAQKDGKGGAEPAPAAQVPAPPAAQAPAPAAAPRQCPTNMDAYAGSDEVLSCVCPEGASRGAVWGTGTYTADSNLCTAAIHAGATPARGGPVTVRMLPGAARYAGTTARGVQTQNYGAYAASFRFDGVQAAAGPQQCPTNMDAYAGSDEVLSCVCPEGASRGAVWGSGTYTADSNLCTAAIHAGATPARGGPVTVRMLPGAARYAGTTARGVQTQNYGAYAASFRFDGVQAAAGPQQCPTNMDAYAGSDEVLSCVCPEGGSRGAVWGTGTYTADSDVCTAAIHAGATPARGGPVTIRMLPGAARYPGTTARGVQSQNFGQYGASFRFDGVQAAAGPQQCPTDMDAYAGSDETLTCMCPEGASRGAVWGSDAYTADSNLCTAALHAGAIGRRGGEVTLRMLPGLPRYPGTSRNGVTTQNFGPYAASYRFMNITAGPQLCPDSMSAYASSDEVVPCVCTGEAVMRSAAVWGSDVYTADSGTCRAARHAGVVPLTGGNVTVRMLPGAARYPGTTRNGVQTSNYGEYAASYRFEGAQNLAAAAPVQAPVADSLRRTGRVSLYVTFRTNSADLDIAAAPVLTQVRDALQEDPSLRLRLVGHTDNQGGPSVNMPLSQRRAQSVRAWLMQNGIDGARLTAEGRGQNEPIADNTSEAGRSLNRRVEAARLE
jgi:outer membrane protein OmpA-like peptidoglycan-associated protein